MNRKMKIKKLLNDAERYLKKKKKKNTTVT